MGLDLHSDVSLWNNPKIFGEGKLASVILCLYRFVDHDETDMFKAWL